MNEIAKDINVPNKNDSINRQAAIDALNASMIFGRCNEKTVTFKALKQYAEGVRERIEALPSAQPERKRGRWQYWTESRVLCPFCKKEPFHGKGTDKLRFCPHCGAEMDGKDGDGNG